jgi:beta-phosphoglucomutase-like phosphatase (HAD superfamily)
VEGELRFERSPDREVVSVVDAERVPRDLCRLRPDPELLRRALRDTGAAPPGTVVVIEPGDVDVVRLSSG